jgi:phosphopantetheine adenylyltransferase/uncharacterized protein (UPF0218 family)
MAKAGSMGGAPQFQLCLVGGTFDRLHAGHRLLLDAAVRAANRVEIHLSSDSMADQKSVNMQSFETRRDELLNWIELHAPRRVSVHELTDRHGPAPSHLTADCIVATPETTGECERINLKREEHGLPPLHIIEVAHLLDVGGGILSSSRIRNGLVDMDGHPWFSPEWESVVLKMHERAEPELKTPMGTLYKGPEATPEVAMLSALEEIDTDETILIAVGDVTVSTLLELDVVPDIGFVDGQTKRQALDEDQQVDLSAFTHVLHASNPAGVLTPSLRGAVAQAAVLEEPVIVVVEGEEDLAPLYVHLHVPLHAVVLYGQPNQGVVVQPSNLATKARCRRLLELFEVV